AAVYAFRSGSAKLESNLVQLGFDLGRYTRNADLFVAEETMDGFQLAMIRTAAELAGVAWGLDALPAGACAGGGGEGAEGEAVGWAKRVYDSGGWLCVKQPLDHPAGKALEREVV